jgi:hypothetical protein
MRGDALKALAAVREDRVEQASGALAVAVAESEAARVARRAAEEDRDAQARRVAGAVQAERAALGRGELLAGDVAAADDWRRSAGAEHAALAASAAKARALEVGALGGEQRAREAVAARRAEARVVADAVARREADQRRSAEARAEEAASEAWRPRR